MRRIFEPLHAYPSPQLGVMDAHHVDSLSLPRLYLEGGGVKKSVFDDSPERGFVKLHLVAVEREGRV